MKAQLPGRGSEDLEMALTVNPANSRRIALHYNFHKTQDVFFDEWVFGADDRTVHLANKDTALCLLIKFDPTIQNSGAS